MGYIDHWPVHRDVCLSIVVCNTVKTTFWLIRMIYRTMTYLTVFKYFPDIYAHSSEVSSSSNEVLNQWTAKWVCDVCPQMVSGLVTLTPPWVLLDLITTLNTYNIYHWAAKFFYFLFLEIFTYNILGSSELKQNDKISDTDASNTC